MSNELIIEVAQFEDIESLVYLTNCSYRAESGHERSWTSETNIVEGLRTSKREIYELIRKPLSIILKAYISGRMVGCVHILDKGDYAYLGMLSVDPSVQRFGIGACLMLEAELFVKNVWKREKIRISVVSERHELIEFYLRRGYKNRNCPFPYPIEESNGIPINPDLKVESFEKTL